jgi:hypothetical protein
MPRAAVPPAERAAIGNTGALEDAIVGEARRPRCGVAEVDGEVVPRQQLADVFVVERGHRHRRHPLISAAPKGTVPQGRVVECERA